MKWTAEDWLVLGVAVLVVAGGVGCLVYGLSTYNWKWGH